MKQLTLVFTEDCGTHITHQYELKHDTWLEQLEIFSKFLKSQGFHTDKRIAIIEPDVKNLNKPVAQIVIDTFYDNLDEVGWSGTVVSPEEVKVDW